jgi:5-formyltetrahydrofolate cyclo-ligase
MEKKLLRKQFLEKRRNLSALELKEKSDAILNIFQKVSFSNIKYLLSYYPLVERNEFDVTECQGILQSKIPDLKIAWPKIMGDGLSMEAHLLNNNQNFQKNIYNIPEPVEGTIVQPSQIDVVFVPLLAFDKKGFRVGYGKGFYDRYLPLCRPDIIKIGFSFFEPLDDVIDINEFDVPLNYCITPIRLYKF